MKEKTREALESWGIPESEIQEILERNNSTELEGYIREFEAEQKVKLAAPKARAKPRRNPNPPEYKRPEKLKLNSNKMVDIPIEPKFDPVAAAMDIVSEAKRQESNPPIKYIVTPCYKLTICSDVDAETMNAVKAELKARGGKWSPELEGFVFDTDPENLL